jgi:hypothetical protein
MDVTFTLISLVISIVCAAICYRIAINKDRNPVGWTLLGFFLPLIGIIVIALLPRKRPAPY